MPYAPARTRLLTLSVLFTSPCLAATARAALPERTDFTVTYHVTDEYGAIGRELTEDERASYVNIARAECGQQLGVRVRFTGEAVDPTLPFTAFIGSQCALAETSVSGQYRRCGQLAHEPPAAFAQGIEGTFHPSFLPFGITPDSPSRDIGDPDTIVGAITGQITGASGLWMCASSENSNAGCQTEEFFFYSIEGDAAALRFDFIPPLREVKSLTVEPGDGSVELHWEFPFSDPGDIAGFRVLCEEVASGAGTAFDFEPLALDAIHTGTHYFTAGNLCGDQPFSTVIAAPPQVDDPNTCGNGAVEAGEACDDGFGNAPEAMCDEGCQLRVSPSLHALDWSHVCSDHIPTSTDSVVIDGLANGKTYNFVLVAYDRAGNPMAHRKVVAATPDEDIASGEGCACSAEEAGGSGLLAMSLDTLFALGRRRRPRR